MAILTRTWRWKRGWVLLLLLAPGMVGFRLGWGWWVQKQLNSKLAELRERKEPVALKDISYPPLSDAENAWKIQLKATMAVNTSVDCPRSSNLEFSDPPYPPEWMNLAAASE